MFARILEMTPKPDKRDDIANVVKAEVLPILKMQAGFLEILPLIPELPNDRYLVISLWAERRYVEKYERETFLKIQDLMRPYLVVPIVARPYTVETSLCEHFVHALAV